MRHRTYAHSKMAFNKLPKGKMKEVDLTEIINKIINLFKHESHVTFNLNFQNNSSFRVIGDENQLIRLFNNLIQNSLQAMDHRGDITLNLSQKENNIRLPLFLKKSDDEGISHYYMGELFIIEESVKQEYMGKDHKVPVVTFSFKLDKPVEENLYRYITN